MSAYAICGPWRLTSITLQASRKLHERMGESSKSPGCRVVTDQLSVCHLPLTDELLRNDTYRTHSQPILEVCRSTMHPPGCLRDTLVSYTLWRPISMWTTHQVAAFGCVPAGRVATCHFTQLRTLTWLQ